MDYATLQQRLADRGCSPGAIDGIDGPKSRAALMQAMLAADRAAVSEQAIAEAAQTIGLTPAHLLAIRAIEGGTAFNADRRPMLLFEPHRFSAATGGRYNSSHPTISYRLWNPDRYPARQADRYAQLLEAVGLDVDAGFASASWGAFQILGENYRLCGSASPFAFAMGQCDSEAEQLRALVRFLDARGLDEALRREDWAAFAKGYNGPGYAANRYDARLADAYRRAGGR